MIMVYYCLIQNFLKVEIHQSPQLPGRQRDQGRGALQRAKASTSEKSRVLRPIAPYKNIMNFQQIAQERWKNHEEATWSILMPQITLWSKISVSELSDFAMLSTL